VRAFCASLKEWDRTAIPRNVAEKRMARSASTAKMRSADSAGSSNWMFTAPPKRTMPVWKVSSMLPRLSAAAVSPMRAAAANLPMTRWSAGTGTVSSASSVPRSFSPAARSMDG
jgi:hypothetical protein